VRLLVPQNVRMMALTATATTVTRRKIISSLSMNKCHVISRNPCKPNIQYVVRPKTTIEEVFAPIVDDILVKKRNAQRTIVFCRNFKECFDIYQYFRVHLRLDMYYPPTAPHLSKFRLVDMFTSVTDESVKTNIIRNFTSPNGHCWVVIGTIAFGLGLDSPNDNGWMNCELFFCWFLEHFLHKTPLMLLLDGHSSHYYPSMIKLAAENGVIMFALPSHTTHIMQPLDRACFAPLKVAINAFTKPCHLMPPLVSTKPQVCVFTNPSPTQRSLS